MTLRTTSFSNDVAEYGRDKALDMYDGMPRRVVRYTLAYRTNISVQLCDQHAQTYRYPLGPVLHGAHAGECEECAAEYDDAIESLSVSEVRAHRQERA